MTPAEAAMASAAAWLLARRAGAAAGSLLLLASAMLVVLGAYPVHWPVVHTDAVGWVHAEDAQGHPAKGPVSLPCGHPIYCYGPVLRAVQMSGLFDDSKTFVDMPCRVPPGEILKAFQALPADPDLPTLAEFVATYFDEVGAELQLWQPPDWQPAPPTFDAIVDPEVRRFVDDIHRRWLVLGRQFNRSSGSCDDCFSSFRLPRPFIIPGGRFREAYYWDSYWVLDGLLLGDMVETARGILDNFVYMVTTYGFVPNGGRIYYTARSQPPLLARMVRRFVEHTGDLAFLEEVFPVLVSEHAFWMQRRAVPLAGADGTQYTLNVYSVPTNVPRPESFKEDEDLADGLPEAERRDLFSHLASGAETGWDYSTRWFRNHSDFQSIQTRYVVPVDLNSLLYDVEVYLGDVAEQLGQPDQAAYFRSLAAGRKEAMHVYMWDEATSQWRDYNLLTETQTEGYYASSLLPVWAGAWDESLRNEATRRSMLAALEDALSYVCGAPTSEYDALRRDTLAVWGLALMMVMAAVADGGLRSFNSGQQWDMPNGWAPLQYFLVETLRKLNLTEDATALADDAAFELAREWVQCTYCGWLATGAEDGGNLFEKYDVTKLGVPGEGGEYDVQEGFGWTNGVILHFAIQYAKELRLAPCSSSYARRA